jgi:lysozyme
MPRTVNAQGLALIKKWEGLRLGAYQDQAGIWTIGYGHTGGVSPGQRIFESDAAAFLMHDLTEAENFVERRTPAKATTDNQFSAMVSLTYNIGTVAFLTSTVLRMHLSGYYAAAAEAFLLWDKAHIDGVLQTVNGLRNRRIEERSLYMMPPIVVSA